MSPDHSELVVGILGMPGMQIIWGGPAVELEALVVLYCCFGLSLDWYRDTQAHTTFFLLLFI